MIPRYSRPAMARLFSDEARYGRWLEVEMAACEALARHGVIPAAALETIRSRARFDVERIAALEAEVRHDVVAFVSCVAENVGPDGRWIHYGLTSSDVLDTALSLTLFEAADLLREGLERLGGILERQALAHRRTVMIGRTHGVHAEPTTLGVKFLLWHADARRALARLDRARAGLRVGKLSGAVGTFAHLGPEIEQEVCMRLGLEPAPIATQVLQRDRHAEYLAALAIIAANLEKIALEIRHLQRTEVREVEEPFGRGQKGSSAMPHKRNPIGCENVCGLARLVRAHLQAGLENIALWHERDISHSSVERVALPDASILVDFMLHRMAGILDGLVIYPERMRANLAAMRGLVFSGGVLLALVRAGLTREEAYRRVQGHAMRVWDEGRELQALMAADPEITGVLPPGELDRAFDLEYQLRHVDVIYRRVLGESGREA